jgi:hypothetical protein
MEKFINSETSLISLRNIVTIFQPKKHTRKGNPGILFVFMQRFMSLRPLAWLSGEGKSHLGAALARFPPCFGHVSCSFECLQLAAHLYISGERKTHL